MIEKPATISAAPGDDDGFIRTPTGVAMAATPCARHCTVCEGQDHHWLAECDNFGEPIMVCKHCDAWREMLESDFDD